MPIFPLHKGLPLSTPREIFLYQEALWYSGIRDRAHFVSPGIRLPSSQGSSPKYSKGDFPVSRSAMVFRNPRPGASPALVKSHVSRSPASRALTEAAPGLWIVTPRC
jgi:hypothetical protein